MKKNLLSLACISILELSVLVSAQTSTPNMMAAIPFQFMPNQPVKWMGSIKDHINSHSPDQLNWVVTYKNLSTTKTISQLKMGLVVEIPEGCTDRPIPQRTVHLYTPQEIVIKPGETGRFDFGFSHTWINDFSRKNQTMRTIVWYSPIYVKYTDGSEWKYDLTAEKGFDNKALPGGLDRYKCTPEWKEKFLRDFNSKMQRTIQINKLHPDDYILEPDKPSGPDTLF